MLGWSARVITTASSWGTATTIASTAWSLNRSTALCRPSKENSGRPTSDTSYPWSSPASCTPSAIMLGP